MKWTDKIILSFFTIAITIIAIYLNWPEFLMGSAATSFNFNVSAAFLSLWLIFSFYQGIKGEKAYRKFILVYWGIHLTSLHQ